MCSMLGAQWARSRAWWRRRVVTSPRPRPFIYLSLKKKNLTSSSVIFVSSHSSSTPPAPDLPSPWRRVRGLMLLLRDALHLHQHHQLRCLQLLQQLICPKSYTASKARPLVSQWGNNVPTLWAFFLLCKKDDVILIPSHWLRLSRPPSDARRSAQCTFPYTALQSIAFQHVWLWHSAHTSPFNKSFLLWKSTNFIH